MPVQIDTNYPTDMQHIVAAISPYASQDAAESDFNANAKGGRDYLANEYQRLTGDFFANPFKDVFQAKQDQLQAERAAQESAAITSMRGAPQTGMGGVVAPSAAGTTTTPIVAGTGIATSQFPPNISALNAREIARGQAFQGLQEQGRSYAMASPSLDVTRMEPGSPDYQAAVRSRVNMVRGGGSFLDSLLQRDPGLLTGQSPNIDPRMQRDKSGKFFGQTALHNIYHDPEFQSMMQRDPERAKQIYTAIAGNGRSLENDIQSQREQFAEQGTERKKVISTLIEQGLKQDPFTGEYTKQIRVPDALNIGGPPKFIDQPLTPTERDIVDYHGGVSAVTGIPFRGMEKLPADVEKNRTPEEQQTIRQNAARISQAAEKSGKPIPAQQAISQSIQQLTDAEKTIGQRNAQATTSTAGEGTGTGLISTLMQYDPTDIPKAISNIGLGGYNASNYLANLLPRSYNAVVAASGGTKFAPQFGYFPMNRFDVSPERIKANASRAAMIQEMLARAGAGFNR